MTMIRAGDKAIAADEEDGRTVPRNSRRSRGFARNSVSVWKTSTLTLGVLFLLYVTEIIEIRTPFRGKSERVEFKYQNAPSTIVPLSSHTSDDAITNSTIDESDNINSAINSIQDVKAFSDNSNVGKTTANNGGDASPNELETESDEFPEIPENTASFADKMTNRHMYKRRGQPMSEEDEKEMIEKWGSWTLVDDKKRPTEDYYAAYPNRDIPRNEFPTNAWQTDSKYLQKFLPEAIKLIERTQEAILAEYGHTEGSWEERTEMFELEMFESLERSSSYIIQKPEWRKDMEGERGGWSTFKSMEGLKRRLLHAIMTEDTFIVAMGGHSSAAGHGNNFIQSYTVQVQWILESVFARLGVRHVSKNFANGGLGTIQHGLAASSVYGPSIDMLIWDSGMFYNYATRAQKWLLCIYFTVCLSSNIVLCITLSKP
jgi:hypothetical protein